MSSLNKVNPTFTVHSRRRLAGGTNNNFSINIELVKGHKYDLSAITRLNLPKTYYTISNNNDSFVLDEILSSATVTIPHGNYNICNFPAVLQEELIAASPNSWNYRVVYNNITKKLEITVFGNSEQPIFDFSNTFIGQQMGWLEEPSDTFVADFLESKHTVNFQKTQFIAILSDIALNTGTLDYSRRPRVSRHRQFFRPGHRNRRLH